MTGLPRPSLIDQHTIYEESEITMISIISSSDKDSFKTDSDFNDNDSGISNYLPEDICE